MTQPTRDILRDYLPVILTACTCVATVVTLQVKLGYIEETVKELKHTAVTMDDRNRVQLDVIKADVGTLNTRVSLLEVQFKNIIK